MTKPPERLLNKAYFTAEAPLQLFHDRLTHHFSVHWHEFYELTYVLNGLGKQRVNGVWETLQPGDLFLLTPADFHSIEPVGNELEVYNLIFPEHMLSQELAHLLFPPASSSQSQRHSRHLAHFASHEARTSIRFRYEQVQQELAQERPGKTLALAADLNRLLLEWHRQRGASAPADDNNNNNNNKERTTLAAATGGGHKKTPTSYGEPMHPGVQQALIYVQHHFRQSLTLAQVARQAHLSPNYFSELFHRQTGMSFQHYVQQLRLQFATALLGVSSLSVTEICYASGFQTLAHFEKVFRRVHGLSPRTYQKRAGS